MKTRVTLFASLLLAVGLIATGCKSGKERPETPTLPKEMVGVQSITHEGVVINNKIVKSWKNNDVIHFWAKGKVLNAPIPFDIIRNESSWKLRKNITNKEIAEATSMVAAFLPEGAGILEVHSHGFTLKPTPKRDKMVDNWKASSFYTDCLIDKGDTKISAINANLKSPYRQLQLIVQNSRWEQEVVNITVTIEGSLSNATYTQKGWEGDKMPITLTYSEEKKKWKSLEADTLFLPFPSVDKNIKATISYTNSNGEKTETISTEGNSITFTLVPEETVNPSLNFTPPIDVAYWKKANQDAYNLITSNYAGEYTEDEARNIGWNQVRPLVDEVMCSKTLYKDDVNVIEWMAYMKEFQKSRQRDWGYAFGLETLEGTLVEVYPPQYNEWAGGGFWAYGPAGYYYTTVPTGKYRLVLFVSYPEAWAGKEGAQKWYKLPMLDALTGYECLNGPATEEYQKRYLEPVSMEKSPYKDMDIIEVVDRNTNRLIAPRWYMGYIYTGWDAYNKHDYLNKGNFGIHEYAKGDVLGVTAVNTTNQHLRGTVVAKAEYLPMFNPIGQWRLDQTAAHNPLGILHGKDGRYYTTSWSKEIGRTEVNIQSNSEQKIAIEILKINEWDKTHSNTWTEIGGRGAEHLGPCSYIHFYWVDESGKETMMMRVDYPMMKRMQDKGYGNKHNRNLDWWDKSLLSQPIGENPARDQGRFANGFKFWF
ncbi:hypothetical protein [Porphyromonas levii]|uniref:hypothetical protein n=1 Tax=Porphyromonas levii TaxID=28114 RepID=UPI001B8B099B|nr:hypothetical protein [Porphyromonas levii]MBR8760534.1 hypothetical protein [Porphyromonas levii]